MVAYLGAAGCAGRKNLLHKTMALDLHTDPRLPKTTPVMGTPGCTTKLRRAGSAFREPQGQEGAESRTTRLDPSGCCPPTLRGCSVSFSLATYGAAKG